jgi:hypothetical protein
LGNDHQVRAEVFGHSAYALAQIQNDDRPAKKDKCKNSNHNHQTGGADRRCLEVGERQGCGIKFPLYHIIIPVLPLIQIFYYDIIEKKIFFQVGDNPHGLFIEQR